MTALVGNEGRSSPADLWHDMCVQVDVYDGTAEHLRSLHLDQDSLTKAIIGTIGDIDSYQLPDAKGYTAFMRHLLRVSNEERQQRREQILGTTLRDFRCFCTGSFFSAVPAATLPHIMPPEGSLALNSPRDELV